MQTFDRVRYEPGTVPQTATAIIDSLVAEAQEAHVSDIHLNPESGLVRVRFRIDGELEDMHTFPRTLHASLLLRLKILCGLRTDEHFKAQDGRFVFDGKTESSIDIRVSIAPTHYGENAVLRLLPSQADFTLRSLGCGNSHQGIIERALRNPHGMILATGPTGSGKTTMLYALVRMLDSRTRSIITIEDPVEYSLPGINQMPVNAQRGLSFADGLRSILRQDPDIIMVGEIRDEETAGLAANAALTGHLVLSTLHTNDAPTALPRLLDMGIEPYRIADTVNLIIAQRLVRHVCPACVTECKITESALDALRKRGHEKVPAHSFIGTGCARCRGTGYVGRTGIFEMLIVDGVIRNAIGKDVDAARLRSLAHEQGMTSLLEDGLKKVEKGITSIEEVMRVTYG